MLTFALDDRRRLRRVGDRVADHVVYAMRAAERENEV
jgi:hypothetical protein